MVKKQNSLFPLPPSIDLSKNREIQNEEIFADIFSDAKNPSDDTNTSFIGPAIHAKRFKLSFIITGFIIAILLGKSGYLQIVKGQEYRTQAEQNRLWNHILPSQRGIIYDRTGTELAWNEAVFNLLATPASMTKDREHQHQILSHIAKNSETPINELYIALEESDTTEPKTSILLAANVPYELALTVESSPTSFPGITTELSSKRGYITNEIPSLSHIIGYSGGLNEDEYEEKKSEGYRPFDSIGKMGIEQAYEQRLRGQFGLELLEINALGSIGRVVSKTEPTQGQNITLTVDAAFQKYIEEVLKTRLEGTPASKASVIAMNPKNGEIYALVSWPAYDANAFTGGIDTASYRALIEDEDRPLFARAFSGEFPSGSTIKPMNAASALIEGIITPETSFISTGGIQIGIWYFPDWRADGHGNTNVYHAIADSVNTFFYLIGGGNEHFDGLGIEKMMEYAASYGFGSQTGLDIAGEQDGFLPTKEWKIEAKGEPWYIGDTYHAAIGQGDFLATPLQIARATAMFANDGHLVTPHVNNSLETSSSRVISTEIVNIVATGMRRTITQGSAQMLQSVAVEVAGKTGTAQWSSTKPPHSWFTGFAPYENPEIVITVLIEEGGDDYLAVPITKDILDYWYQ